MGFGIDFGTTNSAVVHDEYTLVSTGNGAPYPSVVAINENDFRVKCGDAARQHRGGLTATGYRVITSIKSVLDDGEPIRIGGRAFTPRQIAAELFKGLVRHVEKSDQVRGERLTEAVISVPVGFSPGKRRALREAAGDAGIRIMALVSEPTAAYFGCRTVVGDARRVAVFDWGGGTLDVSVLGVTGDQVTELSTEGRREAGDDLDRRIAEFVHNRIKQQYPSLPPFDQMGGADLDKLLTACESAKIDLSDVSDEAGPDCTVNINLLAYAGHDSLQTLSCAELTALSADMVDRAMATLDRALEKAAVKDGAGPVDRVLLIGGSSRLFTLRARMDERFPGRCVRAEKPAWAVAQGASWLAKNAGAYELAQELCLVLSDGTGHVLSRPGDAFDDKEKPFHLGLVDETEAAELIFAESIDADPSAHTVRRLRQIGNLSVPMQGFWSERLELRVRLTPDLTFRVTARGENGNDDDVRTWEHAQLNFAYRRPADVNGNVGGVA